MKKFLKYFKNENEDRLNLKLIKREEDKDLVEYVVNVFKSLQSTGMIRLIDYTIERDESKIDYSKYITTRKKKRKKDGNIKYHFIKENRVMELTMNFRIDVNNETAHVTKSILLPKKDKNNYYMLKGKKYFLLYQMVDSSTYVVKDGLVFKSLMPIIINYKPSTLKDINGEVYNFTSFYMKVFKRDISVLLFYFSKIGFKNTLIYFSLDKIIKIIPNDKIVKEDTDVIFFPINKNMCLVVSKHFFDKFKYVQAAVGMIIECFTSKTNFLNLDSNDYWTEQIGALYTKTPYKMIESGRSTIVFFERLLDLTSKDSLKVSDINKISIYSVNYIAA